MDTIRSSIEEAEFDISLSQDYLKNATKLQRQVNKTTDQLTDGVKDFYQLMSDFNDTLISEDQNKDLDDIVDDAYERAQNLSQQVKQHTFS